MIWWIKTIAQAYMLAIVMIAIFTGLLLGMHMLAQYFGGQ